MKKILLVFLFVLMASVTAESECWLRPICPPGRDCPSEDNTLFPPNGPWIRAMCFPITIKWTDDIKCDYYYCFSYRITGTVAPFIEIFINCFYPEEPCGYTPTEAEFRYAMTKKILETQRQRLQWSIPPCDYTNQGTEVRFYQAACKEPNGHVCNENGAYCAQQFSACLEVDGSVRLTLVGGAVNFGNCPTCTPSCE